MSATDPRAFSWPPGTQIEPDGQIVFRPSWENYRSKMFKVPAFLALIVAFNLFRLDDPVVAIGLLSWWFVPLFRAHPGHFVWAWVGAVGFGFTPLYSYWYRISA